jgi:DNA repair protein RadC
MFANSQDPAPYNVQTADEDATIAKALNILVNRVKDAPVFESPNALRQFLIVDQAARKDQHIEVFSCLYLDSQNKLLCKEDLFKGTLNQTNVYPREVVRSALRNNAAAVILCHNHPSGNAEPSNADTRITATLKAALALVDVRVLDHFIVAGPNICSMAERCLV